MVKLKVYGNQVANGQVQISGAKNAALPLLAASILSDDGLFLSNVPPLSDIGTMCSLLQTLGCFCECKNISPYADEVYVDTKNINNVVAPYDIVKKMRASILVLGPLLARMRKCEVSLPGGCAIGVRPVDLHIKALKTLGANIELDNGYIYASAPKGLIGAEFSFPVVTVTGTENLLMAATLAKGTTVLKNAAKEPEIVDLANCLIKMGAKISGHGTNIITIEGVTSLHRAEHSVMLDRIEAGTYITLAGITHGKLKILAKGCRQYLQDFIGKLEKVGLQFEEQDDGLLVVANNNLQAIDFSTAPYPGFPTDLQAQMMSLLCCANGVSNIYENIWENRFMHVAELARMGAKIQLDGNHAKINGGHKLKGAPVMATDLRASFSLVLAGVVADNVTLIDRLYHLDRGYCCVEQKLEGCGIRVERIRE